MSGILRTRLARLERRTRGADAELARSYMLDPAGCPERLLPAVREWRASVAAFSAGDMPTLADALAEIGRDGWVLDEHMMQAAEAAFAARRLC